MALTSGPNLGLLINGSQAEQHYAQLMRQWRGLDALVQCKAISASVIAQPGTPADGDVYIVPPSATGANWATQVNKIARFSSLAGIGWEFYTPKAGWSCRTQDTNLEYTFDGVAWVAEANPNISPVIPITSSGVFQMFHAGAYLRCDSASALTMTIDATIASMDIGTEIHLRQVNTGQITLAYPGGTITTAETLKSRGLGSTISIIKVTATVWDMTGDMEAL